MQGENNKLLVVWIFLHSWLVTILVLMVIRLYVCVCVSAHVCACACAFVCACLCGDFVILVHLLWALLFIYEYNFLSIMILDSGIHFGVWRFLVDLAVYSYLFIIFVDVIVFRF